MSKGKVYVWIGDDGDNKSVSIERKVYSRDSEIPADKVAPDVLAAWIKSGLVSEAGQRLVSVEATELEAENKALRKELEKAKSGKKAGAVKELEKNAIAQSERIKELEDIGLERGHKIDELETDPKSDGGNAGPGGG